MIAVKLIGLILITIAIQASYHAIRALFLKKSRSRRPFLDIRIWLAMSGIKVKNARRINYYICGYLLSIALLVLLIGLKLLTL